METIWFVLGISGAGKSYFSCYVAAALSFVHYEIDQSPHDGIDHFGFRRDWDGYLSTGDVSPLVATISDRYCAACRGAILSFPSNLIAFLSARHVSAVQAGVKVVILSGEPEFCRRSFWEREKKQSRSLPTNHWETNNLSLYPALQQSWLAPYVLNAFKPNGERRSASELLTQAVGG